ncbi:hypothetical protein Lser_V15G39927 [Lactuca serriola]
MAKGRHRKQVALDMLNNAYLRANVLGSEFAKDIVSARLCSKKMYEGGGDPQVYRTACIDMFEGMGTKNLKVDLFIRTCALHNNIEAMFRQGIDECFYYGNFDLGMTLLRQAADEVHLEAIYFLGMIYISRWPHQCDEGLQLLDAYFGWAVPDDGDYTSVVDSVPKSCCGLLMLFIDLQGITSHSTVKNHVILLNVHWQ